MFRIIGFLLISQAALAQCDTMGVLLELQATTNLEGILLANNRCLTTVTILDPLILSNDTLSIDTTGLGGGGGASLANNGLSMSGDTVQLGGALIKNTAINGAFDLKLGNATALDTFSVNAARINLDLAGQRFLHTTGGGGGGGSYENLFFGYQAADGFSGNAYANTVLGRRAAFNLAGTAPNASSNVVMGYGAAEAATTMSFSTILGTAAASAHTTATNITAVGYHSGRLQTGSFVTALGEKALENNTASNGNTATGYSALGSNTSGNYSTATGFEAGKALTVNGKCTYDGYRAGAGITGEENTGAGYRVMGVGSGDAAYNAAFGSDAAANLTTGTSSVYFGRYAGNQTTTGSGLVLIGKNAGETNTTGSNGIIIGHDLNFSSSTASNELNIGGAIYGTSLYGTSLIGIEVAAPARTLDVNGEMRIRDLVTDTPTGVVGHDADGDLATVGFSGMSMVAGVLTATDGSTTNEIQTYSHAGTTNYTNTLSLGGGSFTLEAAGGLTISHTAGTVTFTQGSASYQTLRDDGTNKTQRAAINFTSTPRISTLLTDDAANNETEVALDISANSIDNTRIRQGVARSVIGVTGGATSDVADIQGAADQVLRVNTAGSALAFGTVATGGIADQAVTYVKIQNAANNNVLLGNNNGAGTSFEELNAAACQTLLGFIDATALANQQIAYGSDANTITSEAAFLYDAANDRMTINCTTPGLGAGAAILNLANVGTDGTGEFIRMAGAIDGNMLAGMYNSSTTAGNNTIFTISQAGNSAADPILQLQISGASGNTGVIGLDNSDGNKIKITPNAAAPGANANASFVGTNDAIPLWGINKDAPAFPLDIGGKERSEQFHGINVSWVAGDFFFGLGAGTGPTFTAMSGTHNFVKVEFSTGTAPAANNAIFSVVRKSGYEFANKGFPIFCAANANAANEITKFYMSSDDGVTYTMTANGTLTASTAYKFYICFSGY
jgi:hypothetical protein